MGLSLYRTPGVPKPGADEKRPCRSDEVGRTRKVPTTTYPEEVGGESRRLTRLWSLIFPPVALPTPPNPLSLRLSGVRVSENIFYSFRNLEQKVETGTPGLEIVFRD